MRNHTWIVTGLALFAMAGCSIEGKWNVTEVTPTAAVRDFDFSVITLQEDGTYYAERNIDGIRTTSGTFRFDGKLLLLNEHNGETLSFDARLSGDGRTIRLEKFWRDQKMKAVLTRKD